jgi:hypothetical protein
MAQSDVRRTLLAMTAGVFLACLSGCDRGSSGDSAGSATAKKSATAQSTADEDGLRRVNAAVSALNAVSHSARTSWRHYARQIDPERGPTGRETGVDVMEVLYPTPGEGIDALKVVLAGRAAKDVLDQASARYVVASDRLVALTAEAHRYYNQKDWRDDKFAKGKSMHPPLVAAYREWEAAHTALSAEAQRIGDLRRVAQLAKLKASGQMLRHDVELSLKQARDVLDFVGEQLAKVKHPHAMDLAGLKERIDTYDATLGTLRTAVSQGQERAKKEFGMSEYNFKRYVEAGDGFLLNAKEVLRAGRERTAMPVHRYPDEQGLTGKFNEMVQSANNLSR